MLHYIILVVITFMLLHPYINNIKLKCSHNNVHIIHTNLLTQRFLKNRQKIVLNKLQVYQNIPHKRVL